MAEQNILSADQSVLEQILSDINEYEENQERLEYISASIKDITKETDSTSKAMQDEISARIKESTDAIWLRKCAEAQRFPTTVLRLISVNHSSV